MIEVLRAGWLTTVQDLGRPGHGALGIVGGGALDPLALRVANLLVGNEAEAAALEITLGATAVRFTAATRIALAGNGVAATLDGLPVHPWWSLPVKAGQTLRIGAVAHSMRAYLAMAGGIDVPAVFGSRGTDLGAGFGGLDGRPLRDGDRLRSRRRPAVARKAQALPPWGVTPPQWSRLLTIADPSDPSSATPDDRPRTSTPAAAPGPSGDDMTLRLMTGGEHAQFSAASRLALWRAAWTIGPQSNRMACRLAGPTLAYGGDELPSHAVLPGTVQVPPDGQPILLLADAQTTGGYPKLGAVIRADLWRLAYARPGSAVRFVEVSREQALAAWSAVQDYLARVARAARLRQDGGAK